MNSAARSIENIRSFPAMSSGSGGGSSPCGGSSSGAGAGAYARAMRASAEQMQIIKQRFKTCIGIEMNTYVQNSVALGLKHTPIEYFLYGLSEAAQAPRPSWRYALAVIHRLEREQVDPATLPLSPVGDWFGEV